MRENVRILREMREKSTKICVIMRDMQKMEEIVAQACVKMQEDARTCEEFN